MSFDPETIAHDGMVALRRGDACAARTAFAAVVEAGRASPRLLLLLADACAKLGDTAGENAALDRVLALDARNLAALTIKGDRAAARGDDRAAAARYGIVLSTVTRDGGVDAQLMPFVERARHGAEAAKHAFRAHLECVLTGVDAGGRFAESLSILSGDAEPQLQQPSSFYYPGLPQTAFYDTVLFDWVAPLEAAAPAIRAEAQAALASGTGFRPYVEADPTRPNKGHALLDNDDWSAFHLIEGGVAVAGNADLCPATMAALGDLPLPRITGRSPMALFSLLKPHTHIPPHWGMLNTRLIVHLPLIVPDGCRLRVGNHVREVVAGKVLIFDDSVQHEAWNDSDEMRVILLFQIWHPELRAGEREALTKLFGAIGSYGTE